MSNNGNVYIVQEPVRRNRVTGDMEPLFDLTPAAVFGNLKVLLPPGAVMLSPAPMVAKLRTGLKDFNDKDYLLAVGDPSAMAAAAGICALFNGGRVNMLKWDRETRRYISVPLELSGR